MKRSPYAARGCGCCFIVPPRILREYSRRTDVDIGVRTKLQETYVETTRLRLLREATRVGLLSGARSLARATARAHTPEQQLFDCRHIQSLPGQPIANPASSGDAAIKTVYAVTDKVAEFYQKVLSRNSIDDRGMNLVSSLHYRDHFDNAFWNGQQMVYGDGDGELFTEFYNSPDVIGHELTHGVTQYESGLRYEGESGALNESISDVFGAAFHQWVDGWPADNAAGWLIGAGIMGPKATTAGKTCLRDMLTPDANHCLSPQPASYANFDPTADVHDNSGIPNKAFALFAQAVGGNAWERALKVWYAACTGNLSSSATFVEFATLTVAAARREGGDDLAKQAAQAWEHVALPLPVA